MAHYAIGDIQGCFHTFTRLLHKIDFNRSTDTLWLTGDIVNRGDASLQTLRFVKDNTDCIHTILGNHDLHLLSIIYGKNKPKKGDTIDDILNAPDCRVLADWLRRQPLMRCRHKYLMVHAGLLPQWTGKQALSLASEVESVLQSNDCRKFFAQMYGNSPNRWHKSLKGMDRLRLITNVMTRMRVISKNNKLDFDFKSVYGDIPDNRQAWFDAPNRRHSNDTIIFGHWSALGLHIDKNVIGLDTGAVWGGELTAINLDTLEVFQVSARQ